MTSTTLGILGTGHLASYTVAGLSNTSSGTRFCLSPRNKDTAQSLARHYGCEVAKSNQQVIDQSQVVLLAVRPHQLDDLLADLKFKPTMLIISAIAGISLDQLTSYSNLKDCTIVRTLLNVSAEVNVGPVPIYPDNRQANELLKNLGTVLAFEEESDFDVATVHGCMHGWIYFWLDEMVNWTIEHGLSPEQAEIMVKQTVQGAIDLSNHKNNTLEEIGTSIATPQTYTRLGLDDLKANRSIKAWSKSMQLVFEKLK